MQDSVGNCAVAGNLRQNNLRNGRFACVKKVKETTTLKISSKFQGKLVNKTGAKL